jgi:hypothetical protein
MPEAPPLRSRLFGIASTVGPTGFAAVFSSDRRSPELLTRQMDQALRLPGVSNAWTMPVKNRIDMQRTGIRRFKDLRTGSPADLS